MQGREGGADTGDRSHGDWSRQRAHWGRREQIAHCWQEELQVHGGKEPSWVVWNQS